MACAVTEKAVSPGALTISRVSTDRWGFDPAEGEAVSIRYHLSQRASVSVKIFDSSVLELLVRFHNDLKANGGVLKIIGLNEIGRDIFYATRLVNLLNIFKDIHEAIRHQP